MTTADEVDAMKLPDLKAKCKELGLSAVGVKADLVARVKEALLKEPAAAGAEDAAAGAADADAEEAAPVAEHADTAAAGSAEPEAVGDGKHKAISFDEALARQGAAKVEVVHDVPTKTTEAPAAATVFVSEADRLKKRAERFQDPAATKLKDRAARFGLEHPEIDEEKKKQRAMKFGLLHPALEEEKRKKRAERFNIVDEETKKKIRQDKFKPLTGTTAPKPNSISVASNKDDADFEDKKNSRALRFGL